MTPEEIQALTQQDLYRILNHWKPKIMVFAGMIGNKCIVPDIESISMNGDAVQINLTEGGDV